MTTFPTRIRFRPECAADFDSLSALLAPGTREKTVLTNPEPAPGQPAITHALGGMVWEMEISSHEEMCHLVDAMTRVEDGHRMLQTIDASEHFTGEAFENCAERSARVLDLLGPEPGHLPEIYLPQLGLDSPDTSAPTR